jgi:hypothetical protein
VNLYTIRNVGTGTYLGVNPLSTSAYTAVR